MKAPSVLGHRARGVVLVPARDLAQDAPRNIEQ
jgi:hypothetical protein